MKNFLIYLLAVLAASFLLIRCGRNELINVPDGEIAMNMDSVQLKGASLLSITSIAGGKFGFGTYFTFYIAYYETSVSRNYKCTENGKLECTENGNNCAQLFCFQK